MVRLSLVTVLTALSTTSTCVSAFAGSSSSSSWSHAPSARSSKRSPLRSSPPLLQLQMAIDYNDPVVAEEFAQVQPMDFEDVEAELGAKGIPVPPTMNEMEVKLMLVEMRLRMSGKLAGQTEPKRPEKFSSKFEEAMWTKPAFKEFYSELKANGDPNAINVIAEYLNNKELALTRYGKDYKALIRKAEKALNAVLKVTSPKLKFSGFPANMGEQGCLVTLQAVGAVADFECTTDEDFPILKGVVTFEDLDSAQKAVEQYNGMDMGMGTSLELTSA